jgi:hypothetical protein
VNLEAARETLRRRETATAMLSCCLPQQRAAIADSGRFKAFFCPRRSGKSFAIGVYLLLTALAYPGSSSLYLGLTKASATNTMNKDVLRVLIERFGLRAEWKESHSRWELSNGSYIYLRGADANRYEIQKVVGQKYRLAVLDEASKYRYDVEWIVYGALVPAMGDDLGTVVMAGTPSNITGGLFHHATTGVTPGWSVHRWTWRENTFRAANIQQIHDELLERRGPEYVKTPLYRQEWLGEWVIDTSALVYRYRADVNTIDALPRPAHEYTYVLGVDLGFTDPSALVVAAYSEHDPTLYLAWAEKHHMLTITDLAEVIKGLWYAPAEGYRGPYPFAAMVCDAAALQAVEEMRQHHRLPLEAAEKPGKRGVIEVMNADLQTGRLKLLPAAASLAEEWDTLIWDERKLAQPSPVWAEAPRMDNHLADAALYAWRKARAYDALPAAPPAPKLLSDEWERQQHERRMARIDKVRQDGGMAVDELPDWIRDMA